MQKSHRVERSSALSVKGGKNLGGPDARGLLERRFTCLQLALPPRLRLGVQLLCKAQCNAEFCVLLTDACFAGTHSTRERKVKQRRSEGRRADGKTTSTRFTRFCLAERSICFIRPSCRCCSSALFGGRPLRRRVHLWFWLLVVLGLAMQRRRARTIRYDGVLWLTCVDP